VSKVLVNAYGAQGERGGLGGWVQALLSVSADQTLYIYVGSVGFNGGGVGVAGQYGGSGGGATDIRTISGNLTSRLIVAGGGGGASYYWTFAISGGHGGAKMITHLCIYISTNPTEIPDD
jgi:Glycine rich protein